ncbi:MAG TPA: lytic transglycosylase domain-containing protein [Stellaceae bacterium]
MLIFRGAALLAAAVGCWPGAVSAQPDRETAATIRHLICRMVDGAAAANRLPSGFLTRVIWQESRFRSDARSRAGAEGVAQFMPQTAAERGLADPSDPEQAIGKAARFLAELTVRYGNLGLAAAAYNAGQGRVAKWLQGQAELPAETRLYVAAVTGREAEAWRRQSAGVSAAATASLEPCVAVTEELARLEPVRTAAARAPAWVVHLDGSLARAAGLLASVPQPRHAAVVTTSQASVDALCASIRTLGANCQSFVRN